MLIIVLCTFLLCQCTHSYNIKTKQSTYKIMKVDLKNEPCETKEVLFREKDGYIFLTKENFLILTTNINNLKICKNTFLEKAKTNLKYYEDIITTLGGDFEK